MDLISVSVTGVGRAGRKGGSDLQCLTYHQTAGAPSTHEEAAFSAALSAQAAPLDVATRDGLDARCCASRMPSAPAFSGKTAHIKAQQSRQKHHQNRFWT